MSVERRPADRPGHQPALSELRRAASAPRLLAQSHDARVLRSVGSLQRRRSSPQGRVKESVRRRRIHAADRYLLTRNVSRLFVQSRTIQARLPMWPELTSTVLYPPPPQRPYRCDGYGDYIFMVSRLTPLKRADLLIRALATPDRHGHPRGDRRRRRGARPARSRSPRELGVADRVTFTGVLTEAELARSPRALPRRVLSAARRGLRLRHRRGVRLGQGGRHVPRQRRAGRARRGRRQRLGLRADAGRARQRARAPDE